MAEAETLGSGPELEMVKRVASRLAKATGKSGSAFGWDVSLIRDQQAKLSRRILHVRAGAERDSIALDLAPNFVSRAAEAFL